MITEFKGNWAFLSNFHLCCFMWNGFNWSHSEGAYQAAKSLDVKDWIAIQRMTPGQSKRYGQKIKLRSDWEEIKDNIMLQIVFAKFSQNKDLLIKLKETGNLELQEGNTWHDRYWGIYPPGSGKGKNKLGLALMQVREIFNG